MTVPDGFTLTLPGDWVALDLDPDTARDSARRLVEVMARNNPRVAEHRSQVEQLLMSIVAQAIDEDTVLYALRLDFEAQAQEPEANLAVRFRSVTRSDPEFLRAELANRSTDAHIVRLEAGAAVRVAEQATDGNLNIGMVIPVPGVEDRVAMISMISSSVTDKARLDAFFDSLADTFRFTWSEKEPY